MRQNEYDKSMVSSFTYVKAYLLLEGNLAARRG